MSNQFGTADAAEATTPLMGVDRASARLRNLLRANSAFSTLSGAIGVVAAGPAADFLGVEQVWIIRLLGVGLLGFAGAVFAVSRTSTSTLARWSQVISLNDFAWVAGTVLVLLLGWLSTGGAITMGLIGLVVLELGLLQTKARRRLIAGD
ncbi:MAG: hypothetical protein ACRBK7_23835 [Acidimicrobiales bacterium]